VKQKPARSPRNSIEAAAVKSPETDASAQKKVRSAAEIKAQRECRY
jgi:hypothetical protein